MVLAILQDSLQNKVKENGSVIIKAENFEDGLAIMTMWLIGKMMVNIWKAMLQKDMAAIVKKLEVKIGTLMNQ